MNAIHPAYLSGAIGLGVVLIVVLIAPLFERPTKKKERRDVQP